MSLASNQLVAFVGGSPALQRKRRAVWERLARRKARGEYYAETGRRALRRVVDDAAKRYTKQCGLRERWSRAFPAADREQAAAELERDFRRRYGAGLLDGLIPQKNRPRRTLPRKGNPLLRGHDRSTIETNIALLRNEGKTAAQAVAMALDSARQDWRADHPGKPLPAMLRKATRKKATKKKKAARKKATRKKATRKKKATKKKKATRKKATRKKATKKKSTRTRKKTRR